MYICLYIRICLNICIYIHVYIYIFLYIYIKNLCIGINAIEATFRRLDSNNDGYLNAEECVILVRDCHHVQCGHHVTGTLSFFYSLSLTFCLSLSLFLSPSLSFSLPLSPIMMVLSTRRNAPFWFVIVTMSDIAAMWRVLSLFLFFSLFLSRSLSLSLSLSHCLSLSLCLSLSFSLSPSFQQWWYSPSGEIRNFGWWLLPCPIWPPCDGYAAARHYCNTAATHHRSTLHTTTTHYCVMQRDGMRHSRPWLLQCQM